MTRFARLTLAVVLAAVCGLAAARNEETMTVREIMGKLNRGPNSLTPSLARDLKEDVPDWELVREQTREYVKLTAALGKNDPPKGDKANWQKLVKAYAANASALDGAARRENKRNASAALAKINKSCDACHDAHRKD